MKQSDRHLLLAQLALFVFSLALAAAARPGQFTHAAGTQPAGQATPPRGVTRLAQEPVTTLVVNSTANLEQDTTTICTGNAVCTLRRAINEAVDLPPGQRPVLIRFDIPTSDAGYLGNDLGAWRITLPGNPNSLQPITGGQVIIDGERPEGQGPRIFLTVDDSVTTSGEQLQFGETANDGNDNVVRGLGLQGIGIRLVGSNNTIEENWLGLTEDGTEIWFLYSDNMQFNVGEAAGHDDYFFQGDPASGNGASISDREESQGNIIRNNVVTGAKFGRAIKMDGSNGEISGNRIGTRADGTIPDIAANRRCQPTAIYHNWFGGWGIQVGGDNNLIEQNTLAGMLSFSLDSENTPPKALESSSTAEGNTFRNNRVGVDVNGKDVGVCGNGFEVSGKNLRIEQNTFAQVGGVTFGIYGSSTSLDAITFTGNTVRGSRSASDGTVWQTLPDFGPNVPSAYVQFNPAVVTAISEDRTTVSGTSGADSPCSGCTIELFRDNTDDRIELWPLETTAAVVADASGNWSATLAAPLPESAAIRTTSTTAEDNQIMGQSAGTTSKVSVLYGPDGEIAPTPDPRTYTPPESALPIPTVQPRPVPGLPALTYHTVITVTSTDDPNQSKSETCFTGTASDRSPCTLRRAINEVRTLKTITETKPLLIRFELPVTDTNYLEDLGVWKMTLDSDEPLRVEGGQVTIDGRTQPGERTDGLDGPRIIITDSVEQFTLDGGDNLLVGLALQGVGLQVNGSNNFIEGNWLGLSDDGMGLFFPDDDPTKDPHTFIKDTENAFNNVFRDNVVAGSRTRAIDVNSNASWVVGNHIGTRGNRSIPLPTDMAAMCEKDPTSGSWFGGYGIKVTGSGNQVGGPNSEDQNYLVGMHVASLGASVPPEAIWLSGGEYHLVMNNIIGQDQAGTKVGVCGDGIANSAAFSLVLRNSIYGSWQRAIYQVSGVVASVYEGNASTHSQNLIDNSVVPIGFSEAVPRDLEKFNPARITRIEGTTVQGTSGDDYIDPVDGYLVPGRCPFCTIELFLDDQDSSGEALDYVASATADSNGNWQATLPAPLAEGQGLRTTSTSGINTPPANHVYSIMGYEAGTTSQLSRLYTMGGIVGVEITGPSEGEVNETLTFSATVTTIGEPAFPMTYTWKTTNQPAVVHRVDSATDVISLTWDSLATFPISLDVENIGGEASDHISVTIALPQPEPAVQFGAATYRVDEGAGTAAVTVTLSAASDEAVMVGYATGGSDDTAQADSDYTPISGTLTFEAGVMTKTLVVVITDDEEEEEDETVTLTLSNPQHATLGTPAVATLTVTDDDAPATLPAVQFGSATFSASEGAGAATIEVTLSEPATQAVTVTATTSDGTASGGDDYTETSTTLTFAPGTTSQTFEVAILDDEEEEGDETVMLTLSDPQHATLGEPASATLTIADDDGSGEPTLEVNHETGAPGSGFIFTATNVPAGASVTIELKRPGETSYETIAPPPQITTGSEGTLVFVLVVPEDAPEGTYSVRVTITVPGAASLAADTVLTAEVEIDADATKHTDIPSDPDVPVIDLGDVGQKTVYLPLIRR
ncbi:MAG: hypothetical protein HC884_09245 [Chloroflexaceae bacterium]|nr:hypothetical protein [Chloroflexaceae bacterium]